MSCECILSNFVHCTRTKCCKPLFYICLCHLSFFIPEVESNIPSLLSSLFTSNLPDDATGPRCVCWVRWHHFLRLQHSLCLPPHHGGHRRTKAHQPQQQNVASVPHLHWPARLRLTCRWHSLPICQKFSTR
jgi:hypothetical protein